MFESYKSSFFFFFCFWLIWRAVSLQKTTQHFLLTTSKQFSNGLFQWAVIFPLLLRSETGALGYDKNYNGSKRNTAHLWNSWLSQKYLATFLFNKETWHFITFAKHSRKPKFQEVFLWLLCFKIWSSLHLQDLLLESERSKTHRKTLRTQRNFWSLSADLYKEILIRKIQSFQLGNIVDQHWSITISLGLEPAFCLQSVNLTWKSGFLLTKAGERRWEERKWRGEEPVS